MIPGYIFQRSVFWCQEKRFRGVCFTWVRLLLLDDPLQVEIVINSVPVTKYCKKNWDTCGSSDKCRNRQRETSVAISNPISTNTELEKKNTLDTNIVCMFTKVGIVSLGKVLREQDRFHVKIRNCCNMSGLLPQWNPPSQSDNSAKLYCIILQYHTYHTHIFGGPLQLLMIFWFWIFGFFQKVYLLESEASYDKSFIFAVWRLMEPNKEALFAHVGIATNKNAAKSFGI